MSNRNYEYELELEGLGEEEFELEGLGEEEFEYEYEAEYEGEFEAESEFESELEEEYEGEEFFNFKKIKGFFKRVAPVLRKVARVAAPMVGTVVGGPLGGLLGRAAGSLLGESEYEDEFEGEFEYEGEFEGEFEYEGEYEYEAPVSQNEALAEYMSAVAARSPTEAEAEAMIGAAVTTAITPTDQAALRRILPHLVRGTAILTRILRRDRRIRPAVRVVPSIFRRTVKTLTTQARTGRPVTRKTAARVMANTVRRTLSNPRQCAHIVNRNVRAAQKVARTPLRVRPTKRRSIVQR